MTSRFDNGPGGARTGVAARLAGLGAAERAVVALSVVAASFLLIDPLILGVVRDFDPAVRQFFRRITDLGKSSWMLLPTGLAFIVLAALRTRDIGPKAAAAYGLMAQIVAFVFVSVAAAGITASLVKNIIGRARPKHFEAIGSFAFEPFAFTSDFASFPSGHATAICALAAALAIFWPRLRLVLFVAAAWIAATRFLIGAHYVSDAIAGAALGASTPYFLRTRLAERRWLFAKDGDGGVRLRGRRVLGWIGRQLRAGVLMRAKTRGLSADAGSPSGGP
ncbi:MAG: phosphatase PAP2 family protein [Methyloligellaceae bacterium]